MSYEKWSIFYTHSFNFPGKLPECRALSLDLWTVGQGSWVLTWLESAGEAWGRPGKAGQGSWAWSGLDLSEVLFQTKSNTLTHIKHFGTLPD